MVKNCSQHITGSQQMLDCIVIVINCIIIVPLETYSALSIPCVNVEKTSVAQTQADQYSTSWRELMSLENGMASDFRRGQSLRSLSLPHLQLPGISKHHGLSERGFLQLGIDRPSPSDCIQHSSEDTLDMQEVKNYPWTSADPTRGRAGVSGVGLSGKIQDTQTNLNFR